MIPGEDAVRDVVLDLVCLGPLGAAVAGGPCEPSSRQSRGVPAGRRTTGPVVTGHREESR